MNNNNLKESFDTLKPTNAQKKRMLQNILNTTHEKSYKKVIPLNKPMFKPFAALAASFVLVVGGITILNQTNPLLPPVNESTTMNPGAMPPSQTSPMGERKMISFEGNRYVFLNNGEAFDLKSEQLGAILTMQNGGTLFTLNNYNPSFRLAFQYEDAFYICENVGHADDSSIDIPTYFANANLQGTVIYADIFDHMGGSILNGLTQDDAITLLNAFATAEVAQLDTSAYEAIAKAQSEGLSYRIEFTLEDYTIFTSYVIPSLNYITVGDYTCTLTDLDDKIGEFFENLIPHENIIMN